MIQLYALAAKWKMVLTAIESHELESVRAMLSGAIDYAGLFPPSQLSMPEAVINFATYRNSNYSWMLGRFVVGVGQLNEFYETAADFISRDAASAWRIAAVSGEDYQESIRIIEDFNDRTGPGVICDTLEIKAETEYQVEHVSSSLPSSLTVYFELDPANNFPDLLSAVAIAGHRAKIRSGGVTADAFPDSASVVKFVQTCLGANVPFKATAGLHHPIRCFQPLTSAANSPSGTMHGFLNFFLMTGFAIEGYRRNFLADVMEEEFPEVFQFDANGVTWQGEFALNLKQIARLRHLGIQSFGSCSFEEPIADLQKLGIL